MTGAAPAASASTIGTAKVKVSGKLETVVVDSSGVTLYTLSGETARHLECTTSKCLVLCRVATLRSLFDGQADKGERHLGHAVEAAPGQEQVLPGDAPRRLPLSLHR